MTITIGARTLPRFTAKALNDKRAFDIVTLNENIVNIDNFIREIPVLPEWRERIRKIELVRAIHGTLAIEGANVNIEKVQKVVDERKGDTHQNISAEQEVINILNAHEFIVSWVINNKDKEISPSVISQLHTEITRDADYYLNIPGQYRNQPVSFGRPIRESELKSKFEVEEAVNVLVRFINEEGKDYLESLPIIKALYSHYLITLIHPFIDGNGRVARALEALVLHRLGGFEPYFFPITADFYYKNRIEYFKLLREADDSGNLIPFIIFAMTGLLENLKRIKKDLLDKITESMIMDYIGELLKNKKILKRHYSLIELAFPLGKQNMSEFWHNPSIKVLYNHVSESTRKRDIRRLLTHGLLVIDKDWTQISVNWDVLKTVTLRLDHIPHRPEG